MTKNMLSFLALFLIFSISAKESSLNPVPECKKSSSHIQQFEQCTTAFNMCAKGVSTCNKFGRVSSSCIKVEVDKYKAIADSLAKICKCEDPSMCGSSSKFWKGKKHVFLLIILVTLLR